MQQLTKNSTYNEPVALHVTDMEIQYLHKTKN